jgi:hypothetical protein
VFKYSPEVPDSLRGIAQICQLRIAFKTQVVFMQVLLMVSGCLIDWRTDNPILIKFNIGEFYKKMLNHFSFMYIGQV